MKFNFKSLVACLAFFLLLSMSAQAEEDDSKPTLDELNWLVGNWQGPGFGGICEEVWLPASAGSMVGTFKMTINGEVQFYEIMTITVDSSGPVLKLKHFNSDLTGWEEKDEVISFSFNSAKESELSIGALTYKKLAEDSLHILVDRKSKDGSIRQDTIKCHLVK